MPNSVARFTNRVENYAKYRPAYPAEVLDLFRDKMGLTSSSVIADIGSGTGISAKLFLENGNLVYGVEPNEAMRTAAEECLKDFPNFKSIDGTAEDTNLPDKSVDFVIAAQAFHWFDKEKTRTEFERILRENGFVALMWNERQLDTTPFLREYEQFLLKFANDYPVVRHENITADGLRDFLGKALSRRTFPNSQEFDFEGLKGRMASSSYMPSESDKLFEAMVAELHSLFAKHAERGKIKVFYDTNIFYTQV